MRIRAGCPADRVQPATLDRLVHRHHQLRPAHAAVAFEQRNAAYDAVAVDFKIDVAEPDRARRERGHPRLVLVRDHADLYQLGVEDGQLALGAVEAAL